MKFYGYRRADGSVGCRNLVAVIPSVVCAADVAQAIVQNVQGAVDSRARAITINGTSFTS